MSTQSDNPAVVFAAGGSGGHLFPGLAVAEQLRALAPRVAITICGTGADFEREHAAASGCAYRHVASHRWPRTPRQIAPFALASVRGYFAARRLLPRRTATVVVGLGGFASVPVCLAAARRGIPLVLLEQNAVLGRANRWLAACAEYVCTAFDETDTSVGRGARSAHNGRMICTGTPIRAAFGLPPADRGAARPGEARLLLVLGGSLGARWINQHVPAALEALRLDLAGWRIVHHCGPRDVELTKEAYASRRLPATVTPFIHDLPELIARANLAISRAGGSTLAELAASGLPAVLVPLPTAADDHQRRNAVAFRQARACAVVETDVGTPASARERLTTEVARLLADPDRRMRMSSAMRALARPTAAEDVARIVLNALRQRLPDGRLPAPAVIPTCAVDPLSIDSRAA